MEVRLGDHLEIRSGGAVPKGRPHSRFPVYGGNGAIGYTAEHNARGPVIVIGRVGTNCGSVRYCDFDLWVSENAFGCRARNTAETRYWYYALQTYRLDQHRAGTGQPLLNLRTLRDLRVPVVPTPQRRRIAALLGAVDDKIAANRRVVAAAEALMVAAAGSVTELVPLSFLASRSGSYLDPAEFDDLVAHFSFPAFDDDGTPRVVAASSIRSGKLLLSRPCVLFAKLNPRIPRIWDVASLPPQMALASSEFVVLNPTGVDTSVLWAALRQPAVSESLRRQAVGTSGSHQRIRPAELLEVPVRDVRRLMPAASQTITELGALCHARRAESVRLAAYREAMLPLLMSGVAWVSA